MPFDGRLVVYLWDTMSSNLSHLHERKFIL